MGDQFTGKDHMSAVFGDGQTDRIPVRAMQSFAPILQTIGLSGKEIHTQPDKYVKALSAVVEISPSDAATILVGDPALFAEYADIPFRELRAMKPGQRVLDDKSKLGELQVKTADKYERPCPE